MSDILEVIKTRRSVRKYKNDMVPAEIIDKIIEAGTYAATGMDRQSPIILAVTDKELRDKLSKMNSRIMGKSEDFDPFMVHQLCLLFLLIRVCLHIYMMVLWLWGILCLRHTHLVWIAAGYIELRKNLRAKKAERYLNHSA